MRGLLIDSRFTASEDKDGDWLVFDNEDFYCCYGPTNKYDAMNKMLELNNENSMKDKIVTDNTQVIINAEKVISEQSKTLLANDDTITELFTENELLSKRIAELDKKVTNLTKLVKSKKKEIYFLKATGGDV